MALPTQECLTQSRGLCRKQSPTVFLQKPGSK